ncbi:hypothetical protein [Janibacter indicus]|uniref:hypothetical protein n=1 Tax=Janibacter indicus TaxID=857417 RepID=UPI003D9A8105
MTDRHDPPWDPEDDELVRAALMSLMDDVRDEPLPEPAFIRARAEGSRDREHDATGTVVELGRRRRRTFAVVAGVAAAALVATSAALIVVDRPGTAPAGTTTVTATDDAITLLDSQEWSAALGLDVTSTRSSADPQGQCFQTPESGSWDRRVSTLADGRVIAGQWIGTSTTSTDAPTDAVDEAVARCEDLLHRLLAHHRAAAAHHRRRELPLVARHRPRRLDLLVGRGLTRSHDDLPHRRRGRRHDLLERRDAQPRQGRAGRRRPGDRHRLDAG